MAKICYGILSKFLKNISIKSKLLLSYLFLIIIPLGIITSLTYIRSSGIMERNAMDITSLALEQAGISLEEKFNNAIKASESVIYNYEIQDILHKDINAYPISQQFEDERKMRAYLKTVLGDQDIYSVRIYVKDGTIYADDNVNFFNLKNILDNDWYKNALSSYGNIIWIPTTVIKYGGIDNFQKVITAARVINYYKSYGEIIGVECIDIHESTIKQILQKSLLAKSGFMVLLDKSGNLISSSNTNAFENGVKEKFVYSELLESDDYWKKIKMGGNEMLVSSRNLKFTDWKLVGVIPVEDIISSSISQRNYSFVLMLAVGIFAYLIALLIAFSIVKRINRLIKTMKKAEQGDLSVKVTVDGKDEVSGLEHSFNNMLGKIEELVEERYYLGQEVKNAELKILQAQINPHFLYNTLELINCMASRHKAQDIKDLVNSLAKFYKLSLSRGMDIISIADEIAHVETYVYIQNKRFSQSIKLEIEVDERILKYSIIKLVLQPIVENSIHHGILEKIGGTGVVKITGEIHDQIILITVQDDGVGMDDEQVKGIFAEKNIKSGNGYGVKNVQKRIQIYYGEQYGLTYISQSGIGTTVEIRIPAIQIK